MLRWFGALWLLGWLILPVSRRLFPRLPDAGLAAGRVLFVIGVTLVCFWGATLHLFPLGLAPVIYLLAALGCASGWRDSSLRAFVRENRRALVVSDMIFAATWTLFLWIRLCHPEVNDLEKPMDMALISAAMHSDWLPFQNPWYSGMPFTNYYYFGHLMGALLAKSLFTAPHLAYNLIQPAFCAFFLSVLWSVGAALSRSLWGGVGVMLLVGLGGHFEPLRQIKETGQFWPLDWWKTSRVIENTINEYPAFTLGVGDLHAHFFALSFAALWFALLLQLFEASLKRRRITLVAYGFVLGAWLVTNTWDAPLFGYLLIMAGVTSRPFVAKTSEEGKPKVSLPVAVGWLGLPFMVAVVTALPYFLKFKSQVSGAVRDPWMPDFTSFFLLWGGWLILGCLVGFIPQEKTPSPEARLRRCLLGVGLVALVAPFLFYIKGYFGDSVLRHQDTVFKFGLQAWLLLGTGISSELFALLRSVWHRPVTKFIAVPVGAVLAGVFSIAPVCVFATRAHTFGTGSWSLNGMKFLPQAEQEAIVWLQTQAPAQAVVLEAVKLQNNTPTGDYDAICGRVSTFSGLPTPLGWPQHVWMWGGDLGQANLRGTQVDSFYTTQNFAQAKKMFDVRYIFFGAQEGEMSPRLESVLKAQNFPAPDGTHAAIGVVD